MYTHTHRATQIYTVAECYKKISNGNAFDFMIILLFMILLINIA